MPLAMPAEVTTRPSTTTSVSRSTVAAGYRRASASCSVWWVVHRRPSSRPARASSLAHVVQCVVRAQVDRGGERLRRPGQVEQVQPRREQEDDGRHPAVRSSTVAIVANRPASAYSVRAMT